jgi:hypothetical protein
VRRLVAAAVAGIVMLTACGGGGGGGDGPQDDVTGTTAALDDQAKAREANLRLSDFPTEWKSTPLPADAEQVNARNNRELAACMGRPPPEELRTAIADSNDFSAADTRRVTSSVQLVRTEEIARDDFAALKGEKSLACHQTQVESEFRRQLPAASPQVSMDRFDLPQFGDETVGFRVDATSLAEGVQIRTFIDLVFIRKGRAELSVSFINRGTPFPAELRETLLQRMVGRA